MTKLKYLVIHCTATPEGRSMTSAQLRQMHTAPVAEGGRGWKQVGYSDMIHTNGGVENLVKYDEDGYVDPHEITNGAAGFNSVCRHIAYVGGIDADGKPKDTRTPEQKKAMRNYIAKFIMHNPTVKVVGHNYLNKDKACPSFDVARWLKSEGLC